MFLRRFACQSLYIPLYLKKFGGKCWLGAPPLQKFKFWAPQKQKDGFLNICEALLCKKTVLNFTDSENWWIFRVIFNDVRRVFPGVKGSTGCFGAPVSTAEAWETGRVPWIEKSAICSQAVSSISKHAHAVSSFAAAKKRNAYILSFRNLITWSPTMNKLI